MKMVIRYGFLACIIAVVPPTDSVGEHVDTWVDAALSRTLRDVEYRGASLEDVAAHIATTYAANSANRPINIRVTLADGDMSDAFAAPTLVSLALHKPALRDLLGALDELPGVDVEVGNEEILIISHNPFDTLGRTENALTDLDHQRDSDGISEVVKFRATPRFSSETNGVYHLLDSSPLYISVSIKQIRTAFESDRREHFVIKNLRLLDDFPKVIDVGDDGSSGGPLESVQTNWIVHSSVHSTDMLEGRFNLFYMNFWPRRLPVGRHVLGVQYLCEAELEDGTKQTFKVNAPVELEIHAKSSQADESESISAWSEMLYALALSPEYDSVQQDISSALSDLIVHVNPSRLPLEDERRIGLVAYKLGLYDVTYSFLSSYLDRYIGSPKETSISDIHDPFHDAMDIFEKVCEDQGYPNPYLGRQIDLRNAP